MTADFRVERDSMGELKVPATALWGAQTQRAVNNFPISGIPMPPAFVRALGLIKWAAADANRSLKLLPAPIANAIQDAALEIAAGKHLEQFPIDVFQTGSGTSSNMNANEVIARLASKSLGLSVHANDHVNMSQSSNDVIPSAIHVSAALGIVNGVVKTGRTHLMDAMPVRLDQELGGWAAQVLSNVFRLKGALPRLTGLAQGGTAVGTGINAHPKFAEKFTAALATRTKVDFHSLDNFFEAMSSQDTAVEVSGILKTTAVSLLKIANDLRWMNSGPLAGLGEISLPALQPGSSIMPGKVNPVIPEAVAMVASQVIGNDATITVAGGSGNFQLNVMLPVIALNLIQSIELLASAARVLADSAIAGFKVNQARLEEALERNPILVTALNPVIGYEKGAAIAKQAYKEGRAIRDVAEEETDLGAAKLKKLLDPLELTKGGIKGNGAGGGG